MEVCRCGAEIELVTINYEWNGFPKGTQVWASITSGSGLCIGVTAPYSELRPWTSDELHRPLEINIEDAIADLKGIEKSLR